MRLSQLMRGRFWPAVLTVAVGIAYEGFLWVVGRLWIVPAWTGLWRATMIGIAILWPVLVLVVVHWKDPAPD